MKIRIAITDDHPMVIDGLKTMLSKYGHIEIISTYLNGEQLLRGLERQIFDVLLLDIQLPGKTGEELAPAILKKYPDLKILVLTNFDSKLYLNNMLRNGVRGYLLKTTDKETLTQAIDAVYKGEQFIDPELRDSIPQLSLKKKGSYMKVTLTTREEEILRLIVGGCTTPEIAQKLFLSPNTIENHRSRIFIKMDVKNMAELTKKALRMGFTE